MRAHRPAFSLANALAMSLLLWPALAGASETELAEVRSLIAQNTNRINMLWVIAAAALVFLMQAGFLVFEVGLVRVKNTMVTAMKNVGDWIVVSVAFFLVGFGLMFGHSLGGWIGVDLFLGEGIEGAKAAAGGAASLEWSFAVFQLAFCGTAATIVSGAMAERTGFKAYLAFAFLMGALIYPIYGHWVWGGLYFGQGNEGWLYALGYRDFAGSSVVHGVGAWASLAGIKVVGPRLGRYGSDGRLNRMDSYNMGWSAFGVLLLWFGWWGFNGGSTLIVDQNVAPIIFKTNLAAAMSGLAGFVHAAMFQRRQNIEEKFLGSVVGGLVAITACCDVVTPVGALLVGLAAGPIHNLAFDLVIKRWRLDDVVGAVPVHGACGVWGCLAVGLLGQQHLIPRPRIMQIGVQGLGVLVCFVFTYLAAWIAFRVLRATVGIRVDPMREIQGLALSSEEEPAEESEEEGVDKLMSDIRQNFNEGDRFDDF